MKIKIVKPYTDTLLNEEVVTDTIFEVDKSLKACETNKGVEPIKISQYRADLLIGNKVAKEVEKTTQKAK